MTKKNIITINGRQYDAITGLPITTEADSLASTNVTVSTKPTIKRQPSNHQRKATVQRSQTLRRDLVKKPTSKHHSSVKRATTEKPKVARSPHIQKFAPDPIPVKKAGTMHDISHNRPAKSSQSSPSVVNSTHKRIQSQAPSKPTTPPAMSAREIKESLIAQSLQKATPQSKPPVDTRKSFFKKPLRASSIMAGALAVVILGGYTTYINMPGISTRVASSQAGITASYPSYKPDGYRFKGPVVYGNGEVAVSFASNSGPQDYTITQKRSTWDSSTVLDSYVLGKSDNYTANTSQGITVYTYNNGAAWVNRGILYTLEGDATLSTEQVLRIANSM